ncbi:MAG: type III-B CRISPR module RAMP protein Cmr6 [Methanothrix sp.]
MSQSCRNAICKYYDRRGDNYSLLGTNAGLIRDKYLRLSANDADRTTARGELLEAMRLAITRLEGIYGAAFSRNKDNLPQPSAGDSFKTSSRMIIGLGGENVLETGISLQHTYGTPFIPGSALKGLTAHYCDQVWGAIDTKFKLGEEYHETIFGTTEDSGHIIFHDAWITPESLGDSMKPDVMTPHHSVYYSNKEDAAPTDFDDPIPITFLSIVGGFYVTVSCDVQNEVGEKWAKLVFKMLTEALKEWGIGGKTNAGYGRLVLENLGEMDGQSSVNTTDLKIPSSGPDVQRPPKQAQPAARKRKYKKGDTVEVTKIPDPKEKRGASYFVADDGIGGLVVLGTAPSVEIGQKTRLEINGVMEKEGLYNFAAIGAKREPAHQARDKRGRR